MQVYTVFSVRGVFVYIYELILRALDIFLHL